MWIVTKLEKLINVSQMLYNFFLIETVEKKLVLEIKYKHDLTMEKYFI